MVLHIIYGYGLLISHYFTDIEYCLQVIVFCLFVGLLVYFGFSSFLEADDECPNKKKTKQKQLQVLVMFSGEHVF